MDGVGHHGLDVLQHEGVGGVDEEGHVALGGRLETQLTVTRHGRVHEHDRVRQLTVIQHLWGDRRSDVVIFTAYYLFIF